MNRKLLAVALVAPMLVVGPTSAWAHHGCRHHHHPHHHHARCADDSCGSGKTDDRSGAGTQENNMDQGAGSGGATDNKSNRGN